MKEERRLANSDEIFEEVFAGGDEGGVGEGVEGATETDFVAG
jgi:hypothetical protein